MVKTKFNALLHRYLVAPHTAWRQMTLSPNLQLMPAREGQPTKVGMSTTDKPTLLTRMQIKVLDGVTATISWVCLVLAWPRPFERGCAGCN
eukprot:6472132-Amphidinium_carterae.1